MIRLLIAAAALAVVAAAPAGPPRPGAWTITVHPNPIPIPAMLEKEHGETLRAMMRRTYDNSFCLTPAQRADPKPLASFTGEKSCTVTRLNLKDGFLTGEANCSEGNQAMTAVIDGTYTPTTIAYSLTRVHGGLDRSGTVALTVTGSRTGECKGDKQ